MTIKNFRRTNYDKWTGDTLILKDNERFGTHTIRVAANRMGKSTNIQTVQLLNGKVAGTSDHKTLNDQIIYCMMIDRFNNGDPSNDNPIKRDSLFTPANYQGGDLQGIINKIDDGYFNSLGVNTFWISPIVDNTNDAYREYPAPHRYYTGYHGYWPVSATKVEEKFGDMNLAKQLGEKSSRQRNECLVGLCCSSCSRRTLDVERSPRLVRNF